MTGHPDQTVLAVCHAGVVEASFCLAFGLGASAQRVAFDSLNTGITHWRHQHGSPGEQAWTPVAFNDAGHLAGRMCAHFPHPSVPTPTTG